MGEFGLIAWLRQHATGTGRRTVVGIGDDCAILRPSAGAELLVTTDMLMDGRHFRLEHDGPEAVGYKALGVNLSDIAAMAGRPGRGGRGGGPAARPARSRSRRACTRGMMPLAERFGVDLVGGDTNAWDGPLVISVTLLGEATARGAGPALGREAGRRDPRDRPARRQPAWAGTSAPSRGSPRPWRCTRPPRSTP